jgi:murein DD-endopeptidase MepM/ murein hydrolase activator NlpD
MTAVLLALVVVTLLSLSLLSYKRWEGSSPQVIFSRDFKALGRGPSLELRVEDPAAGLKHVSIRLRQKDQEHVLVDESFPGPSFFALWRTGSEKSRSYDAGKLIAGRSDMQQGPASLIVSVSDYALRNFFRGNRVEIAKDFEFDLQPPRLEILSGQHYINQGGSECVVYRTSDDTEVSGVQVGPHFFPGFPVSPANPNVRFSLFAYSYDLPANTPVTVIARDAAGNEVVAQPWQKVFPRAFRSREIAIDDGFLQKVVPEIRSHYPEFSGSEEPIKTFVQINSQLRRTNHETISKLSKESQGQFLWNGAFLQLSNSQVESYFADRRTYVYQGNPVDQQDHVGFDLSVVQRYPIEAANDGKVILADYFGIYGNTVLIDHGAGLVSLYGHMNSMDVKTGQTVNKKTVLGKSGATGLAGGDHLHFGLFLHGVPVNPTEWWDPKWVQEHVLDRLKGMPGS